MISMLSQNGRQLKLLDGFKYRSYYQNNKKKRWRCTKKSCNAKIVTDIEGDVLINLEGTHTHQQDENVYRQVISNSAKRRACDTLFNTPIKVIKSEIVSAPSEVAERLTSRDIVLARRNLALRRRKTSPAVSNSNDQVHKTLMMIDPDSSNAASEETNEDDPLSENPHQSDGDLQPVCSDSVMQDCKHEIVFEERVTKIEPSVDSSDTTSGIDIVKFDPDFEFSPVLKKRDSEQNEVLEHVSTVKKERDNFDIFGELVAHKLRHLRTDYARTTVEHLISNILYEASMGKYDFPESNASSSASSQVTSSLISNL
ncbi:uncharacterized protein [Anabrus simplex]|uniref:uncharacterized protein isoform X2 n=1 Tax=Anabrus simplex TaxID=316456 RepID=UPI0035A2EDEE